MTVSNLNLFSQYYRTKYGKPVGKIALSTGLICPNRKNGGCIYCSSTSFTPYYLKHVDSIDEKLSKGKTFTVPEDSFFAMGDNSWDSQDSRYWGTVPGNDVIGRPLFIYYPFTKRWGPSL